MGSGEEKTVDGVSKQRIAGAVIAGTGAYLIVRVMQKTGGDILRQLGGAVDFFTQLFGGKTGFGAGTEALVAPEPFAISIGLITGGMILAGQNPGEILKGIGEIIPL